MRSSTVRKALDHLFDNNDLLLFGSSKSDVPLSTLHPQQVHIFRLWQIYLDNINPIFKITHTPSLQTRLLEAAADVTTISPPLEALMFSIYCVAVVSLQDEECNSLFGSPKEELLSSYQLACQQALQNCRILRTTDIESLTALFLYYVSWLPPCHTARLMTASRYRSDRPLTHVPSQRCSASAFALPSAWASTPNQ